MTLYFFDKDQPIDNTPVYLDSDYSGYETYRVELLSMYTNTDIEQDSNVWLLEADLVASNERYTTFTILNTTGAFVESTFRSGYYTFKLWGSLLDIAPNQPFDKNEWTELYTQECKVKTGTTNDMQRGEETQTIKYTTEPNTAKSYVIYNQ